MWANEIDGYCADWLRNLFPGISVDERSICDLKPSDVQCGRAHFFAGIGGWEYALQLAGWPVDREVWTGSCPCQPLSCAGRRKGHADERHLWPAFYSLIAECRPATIFGEQVASNLGREWLAGVRADLEGIGYALGCADLCAASVGAPHIRQRLFWVAHSNITRLEGIHETFGRKHLQSIASPLRWHWGSEPKVDRLAHGVPARASKLRAYGNAIVPQVAATFIKAFLYTENR